MKYHQRTFSGEVDKFSMVELARRSSVENLHVIDLPYRLSSWALDEPANIGLWFDEREQLTAWPSFKLPSGQSMLHQEFRKNALGRVALSAGLHRLQTLGAKEVFVETDSHRNTAFRLYEFFDLQVSRNILAYRKDSGR